ncbi:MAG TPA: phage holin family protein [Polyangiaceae bacterium]|nr:phage holin family protein [Polyangiaceae bacterium]
MTASAPIEEAPRANGGRDLDLAGRVYGAFEVLVGAHAARAQREATDDAKRVVAGAILVALAAALMLPVVLLFDVAVAVVLVEKYEQDLALSLALVAVGNLVVALAALAAGRARLRAPVLKETRATLKRAAQALRG